MLNVRDENESKYPSIVFKYIYIELLSIHATYNYSKCITLMTSKRQRNTYRLDTVNMVEKISKVGGMSLYSARKRVSLVKR